MVVKLNPELEKAVQARADKIGKTPDEVVDEALRRELLPRKVEDLPPPRDEWERQLMSIPVETGVSLTDEQVSRECIYED